MDVALLTVITVKTGLLMIACCAAAVSCVFAAYVSRDAHALYVMGCAAAALIVALALHLSYDAFSQQWREAARSAGYYQQRQFVQLAFTLMALGASVLATLIWAAWPRRIRINVSHVALALSLLVVLSAALRVVSYHPVDAFFAQALLPGVSLRMVIDGLLLSSISLLAIMSICRAFYPLLHSARVQRVKPGARSRHT